MTNDTCPWHLFDEQERGYIDDQLYFMGRLSALYIWFLFAYCHPTLKDNLSYLNMSFFMLSAWFRRASPIVTSILIDTKDITGPEMPMCGTLGFLETFMAIHEVECLTHICIERYVVAKYIANGWPMIKRHYVMFRLLCLFFSAVYSLAPVLGCGSYGLDFTCTSCTMDLILPEGLMKYFVVAIFALRSIKPVGYMIIMLIWAKQFESTFTDTADNRMQKQITQDAIVMTAGNLICWAPIGLVRGWVVLSQLLHGPGVFSLPEPYIVKAAMLCHSGSLISTILILFLLSPNIRNATLSYRPHHISGAAASLFRAMKLYKRE